VILLADLRDLFAAERADALPSARIVEKLTALEDRPWPEWRHGRPITTRQLAALLRPFGLGPMSLRIGATVAKGYHLEVFSDAFSRYLAPVDRLHRNKPQNSATFQTSRSVTRPPDVTDRNANNSLKNTDCYDVTDQKPPVDGEGNKCNTAGDLSPPPWFDEQAPPPPPDSEPSVTFDPPPEPVPAWKQRA